MVGNSTFEEDGQAQGWGTCALFPLVESTPQFSDWPEGYLTYEEADSWWPSFTQGTTQPGNGMLQSRDPGVPSSPSAEAQRETLHDLTDMWKLKKKKKKWNSWNSDRRLGGTEEKGE